MSSGEQATGIKDTQSMDVDAAPVDMLHRVRRANPHDHRMFQRSASSRQGNHHHGNQRRHPLQPSSVQHHISAPDKPLVRRKRIRRDSTLTLEHQAPVSHLTTAHQHSSAELPRDKPKPKPGHVGKTHRRKFVHRRGRGHSLPHNLISLHSQRQGYGERVRDRKASKPIETSTAEHHQKQKARDQHRLLPEFHQMYRARSGKTHFSQASSLPESLPTIADEVHAHPAVLHRVRIPPRRRAPASGSGERRRRLPVVQKSGVRSHHRAVGLGVSQPLKRRVTSTHQRGIGPHLRINDR